jgi:hypothetical protein
MSNNKDLALVFQGKYPTQKKKTPEAKFHKISRTLTVSNVTPPPLKRMRTMNVVLRLIHTSQVNRIQAA